MDSFDNVVLPPHANPIVLKWLKQGKAIITPGPLDTPCWVWTKTLLGGYAKTKNGRGHRIAINARDGMLALHSCDIKSCVNPWHLREGTQVENMADLSSRGKSSHPLNDKRPKSMVVKPFYRETYFQDKGLFIKAVYTNEGCWLEKTNSLSFNNEEEMNQWISKEMAK
jgi:hypothetical protein